MELEPNQTIYINNINEKVKKDVLKKQLYMLFSQYGKVKQIVACKGIKLRGQVWVSCANIISAGVINSLFSSFFLQAWIVFHDLNSAINAMKGKQGFVFYDKPMVRILALACVRNLLNVLTFVPILRTENGFCKDEIVDHSQARRERQARCSQ